MAESALPIFPFAGMTGLDAFTAYDRMRPQDPLPIVELAEGGRAYLAIRYADVRRVLNDPVFSRAAAQRPESVVLSQYSHNPYSMLNMDPPDHTRIRRVLMPSFSTGAMQRLRPRVQEITDGLVDAMIAQGPPAEFVSAFAAPLPAMVIAELLGIPHSDHNRIRNWLDVFVQTGAYTPEQFAAIMEEFTTYLSQLIASKRAAPPTT
jgi:cytochrome P450